MWPAPLLWARAGPDRWVYDCDYAIQATKGAGESWGGRGLFDVNLDNLNGNVFISYALVFLLLDVIVSAAICKVFGQE